MFKFIKRFNPFYRKKRRYNKRRYRNHRVNVQQSDDIQQLFRNIFNLERKVNKLIKVSGFRDVNGIIMDEHEAKKYEDQDNVGF